MSPLIGSRQETTMWFKKKQPTICTLIGEGTTLKGDLTFTHGVRIDGEILGDVTAVGEGPSVLVISETARVQGVVTADHVIVNGMVLGPVRCGVLLELQPKARITGDVRYEKLEMHVGATVDGALQYLKSEEKPALKLAASNEG
jgi:cytoskeletal protein CcmA (bactofilin family)